MTTEDFEREAAYQATMVFYRNMLSRGLLTPAEYAEIETIMLKKCRPLLGSLFAASRLTCGDFRANMVSESDKS